LGERRFLAASVAVGILAGTFWLFASVDAALAAVAPSLIAKGGGLDFTVDMRWVQSPAYRPVKIQITPTAPVTADRSLTIEFVRFSHWRSTEHQFRLTQDIEIPAGSGPLEITMAIPRLVGQTSFQFSLVENGNLITTFGGSETLQLGARLEAFPAVLVIHVPPLSIDALRHALAEEAEQQAGAAALSSGAADAPAGTPAKPQEAPAWVCTRGVLGLPKRWIDYSSCDIICLRLDDVRVMHSKNPEALAAIVDWVWAGGTLLVGGLDQRWQQLGEVESLAKLPRSAVPRQVVGTPASSILNKAEADILNKAEADLCAVGLASAWKRPDPSRQEDPLEHPSRRRGAFGPIRPIRTPKPGQAAAPEPSLFPADQPPFLVRQHGLGMIVAVQHVTQPRHRQLWTWLLNSVGSERWLWCQRHGMSVGRINPEFWNYLIPGVGLPPVNAFRVLISVFVLVIGPVNYWLLYRLRRLHLLVVTVPLGAGVVTLGLFAYALLADGLGTRVRVRSVTVLDQRCGRAACWARLSYYSGLLPSGGLRFPADVAVTPLAFVPSEAAGRRQEMRWHSEQELSAGWMAARVPMQLLTVRSRATAARLDIVPTGQGKEGIEVTNRLGAAIKQLVLCDRDGKYYQVGSLASGETARAAPIAPAALAGLLGELRQRAVLWYPQGIDPLAINRVGSASRWRLGTLYGYSADDLPEPSQSTSRLEKAIGMLGAAPVSSWLVPGTYMAIMERSPEVVLGTNAAREESAFHVVLGSW